MLVANFPSKVFLVAILLQVEIYFRTIGDL